MFDDTVHHLWVLDRDPGTDYIHVVAACADERRIVPRVTWATGSIDPHFTSTDLCARCARIAVSV